ncbi:hypothetical protein BGX20_004506 [Mortierella sp. AD010]|nr:hypothetical protein BGX20_004506 [Mortierella sp. AD010]
MAQQLTLAAEFESWKNNKARLFWAEVMKSTTTALSLTQTETSLIQNAAPLANATINESSKRTMERRLGDPVDNSEDSKAVTEAHVNSEIADESSTSPEATPDTTTILTSTSAIIGSTTTRRNTASGYTTPPRRTQPRQAEVQKAPYLKMKQPINRKRTVESAIPSTPSNRKRHHRNPTMVASDQSPFMPENAEEQDLVTIAQKYHGSLNHVFDITPHSFTGRMANLDVGALFTAYYNVCANLPYDMNNTGNFITLSGSLYMTDKPTKQQQQTFGVSYDILYQAMKGCVHVISEDSFIRARNIVRAFVDPYKLELRTSNDTTARFRMMTILENASESSFKRFFYQAAQFYPEKKYTGPRTENDLTSRFLLPMLNPIFTQLPHSVLMNTATSSTSGSRQARLENDLGSPAKFPDLIVTYNGSLGEIDVAFGEMRAVGDICIGFRFATLHVPFGMDDVKNFEDQIDDWLLVEKAFLEFLNILSSATPRTGFPPPAFSGLHTPSSKHMSKIKIRTTIDTVESSDSEQGYSTVNDHSTVYNGVAYQDDLSQEEALDSESY